MREAGINAKALPDTRFINCVFDYQIFSKAQNMYLESWHHQKSDRKRSDIFSKGKCF